MDIYIPCATKPKLHAMCPFCKEDATPHIEFDHTAPVLCCMRGDRPEEIPRSRYLPCGVDVDSLRKEKEGEQEVVHKSKCCIARGYHET